MDNYRGWLRNPAPPTGWLKQLKPYIYIYIYRMGCLPSINWCRISQPSTVLQQCWMTGTVTPARKIKEVNVHSECAHS